MNFAEFTQLGNLLSLIQMYVSFLAVVQERK